MEKLVWRYTPEFRIRVRINNTDPGEAVSLALSPLSAATAASFGLLVRATPGGLTAFCRQHFNGVSWVPATALTQPVQFSFWLMIDKARAALPDFFEQGTQQLGRRIFYASNLSAAGVIDANLAGNVVALTAAANAGSTENGALSGYLLSHKIVPGAFNQIRAGKIAAGAPVSFTITETVTPLQDRTGLDLRPHPRGAYVVRLEGGTPLQEKVVFDQSAATANVCGVIDIFKQAWHLAPQPREYSINFQRT